MTNNENLGQGQEPEDINKTAEEIFSRLNEVDFDLVEEIQRKIIAREKHPANLPRDKEEITRIPYTRREKLALKLGVASLGFWYYEEITNEFRANIGIAVGILGLFTMASVAATRWAENPNNIINKYTDRKYKDGDPLEGY
jgi:hypothetical protein